MADFRSHLRNTLLAGAFVVVPIGVTAFLIWKVEMASEEVTDKLFHRTIPVVGILIAVAVIYFTGLLVSSMAGKWTLRWVDRGLNKLPLVNAIVRTWKQIALTPGGTEGTFSKVVLIPSEVGGLQIGFTSGRSIEGQDSIWCVFVPSAPNPLTGRMYFIDKSLCKLLTCSPEEAIKTLISTGNYVPAEIGAAIDNDLLIPGVVPSPGTPGEG